MTHGALPLSGPLHIDCIDLPGGGRIGMTHCPGRCKPDARGRSWQRELKSDVDTIRRAGFESVLSLLPSDELAAYGVPDLGGHLQQAGLAWHHFPIVDFGVPDLASQRIWSALQASLTDELRAGRSLLVHCAAGLGRTGTMVALLMRARGLDSQAAIATVRAARPGTIETLAQERFVADFAI